MFKHQFFSGPYFPAFGLNRERYSVSLRAYSDCGEIRTRKNFVFGHFLRSENVVYNNVISIDFLIVSLVLQITVSQKLVDSNGEIVVLTFFVDSLETECIELFLCIKFG